jgi:hypothetical protein
MTSHLSIARALRGSAISPGVRGGLDRDACATIPRVLHVGSGSDQ